MRNILWAAALAGSALSAHCLAIATDNWPTYQGNIARNGYLARAPRVDLLAPAWNVNVASMAVVDLAIYKGVLYVVSVASAAAVPRDVQLTARSLGDGHVLWTADLGLADAPTRVDVDGDTIYAATFNPNTIYAYATNGNLRWSKAFAGSTGSSDAGPLAVDGTVYFFDGTNAHAYAATDGSVAWETALPSVSTVGGAPTWWNGRLLRHTSNHLDIIDAATGQPVVTLPGGTTATASPGTAGVFGTYAYTYDSGTLLAYDLVNAQPYWSAPISNGTPAVTDGREVVAGGLTVLDPASGAVAWQSAPQQYGGGVFSALVLTDTHVIATSGGSINFINRQSRVSDLDVPFSLGVGAVPIVYAADTLVIGTTISGGAYLSAYSLPIDDIFDSPFE